MEPQAKQTTSRHISELQPHPSTRLLIETEAMKQEHKLNRLFENAAVRLNLFEWPHAPCGLWFFKLVAQSRSLQMRPALVPSGPQRREGAGGVGPVAGAARSAAQLVQV